MLQVSTAALAKILQHGVSNNDSRLTEIIVQGDQIHSETRVTRSSKRTEQWTQVPLLAKLLKLLINEMNNIIEEANDEGDSGDDEEEWDDDSQDSDSSFSSNNKAVIDMGSLLAPAEDYHEADEDDDDLDCKADPLYSLDMKQYLVQYIREFSAQPYFSAHFASHLNPAETETVRSIVTMN